MDKSKIEWTERSDWNPIRGCTRVSEGCRNCYAEAMAARFCDVGNWGHGFAMRTPGGPRWTNRVELQEDRLTLPLRWRKPAKVFVSSTSDVFHEMLPAEAIDRIFAVMAVCPRHTFQILTKRAERMRAYLSDPEALGRVMALACDLAVVQSVDAVLIAAPEFEATAPPGPRVRLWKWPLPNVWLGVSAEDQGRADERIPHLLATPAALRFVSCEPLLGPIDLLWALNGHACQECADWGSTNEGECDHSVDPGYEWKHAALTAAEYAARPTGAGLPAVGSALINWVIAGGESGPRARPMHTAWARSLRDQCGAAEVPFFFKQNGGWLNWFYFGDAGIEDDEEATRYETCIWDEDHFEMIGRPIWSDLSDFYGGGPNTIDDPDQVFGRVGKARSGCLLDGREHKAFPVI